MGQNCPYYRRGKCANPNGDHRHDCSWPKPDFDACAVYVLITDPARGLSSLLQVPRRAEDHGSFSQAHPPRGIRTQPESLLNSIRDRSDEDLRRKEREWDAGVLRGFPSHVARHRSAALGPAAWILIAVVLLGVAVGLWLVVGCRAA